jgi:hypothetical protein
MFTLKRHVARADRTHRKTLAVDDWQVKAPVMLSSAILPFGSTVYIDE